MAPRPRAGWNPDAVPSDARQASVLLLLYRDSGRWVVPLTKRADTVAAHRGQISFIGGGREGDESPEQTALREAHEEIGIDPGAVQVLGRLTAIHIPRSNYQVVPVIGVTHRAPEFRLQTREVQELLLLPIDLLRDPEAVRCETWTLASGTAEVPFFALGDHKVWGATAMILAELSAVLAALC